MNGSIPATEDHSGGRWQWSFVVALAFALLATAWILAHWPPIQRAASLDEAVTVSVGYNLLIAGGLPWLLQWAALAVLLLVVARRKFQVAWGPILSGIFIHFTVGMIWWVGLAAMFWTSGPMDVLMVAVASSFGSEPLSLFMLFYYFGPLTCPLLLRGPLLLQGWDFLWAGLSTGLVMSYLTWASHRTREYKLFSAESTVRQHLEVALWGLVYVSPALMVISIRLVRSLLRLTALT